MSKKYPDLGHLRIDAIGSINQAIELSVKVYDLEKDLASAHQHATEVAARVVELEREVERLRALVQPECSVTRGMREYALRDEAQRIYGLNSQQAAIDPANEDAP